MMIQFSRKNNSTISKQLISTSLSWSSQQKNGLGVIHRWWHMSKASWPGNQNIDNQKSSCFVSLVFFVKKCVNNATSGLLDSCNLRLSEDLLLLSLNNIVFNLNQLFIEFFLRTYYFYYFLIATTMITNIFLLLGRLSCKSVFVLLQPFLLLWLGKICFLGSILWEFSLQCSLRGKVAF